jgi:hypothetical protein
MLFVNSQISTNDASMYFFSYCHRFKLSITAKEELLKLIRLLLPEKNNFPKTLDKLKDKIGLDKIDLNVKEYCEKCKILLPSNRKFVKNAII